LIVHTIAKSKENYTVLFTGTIHSVVGFFQEKKTSWGCLGPVLLRWLEGDKDSVTTIRDGFKRVGPAGKVAFGRLGFSVPASVPGDVGAQVLARPLFTATSWGSEAVVESLKQTDAVSQESWFGVSKTFLFLGSEMAVLEQNVEGSMLQDAALQWYGELGLRCHSNRPRVEAHV
jgi:hypothetical protein